MLNFTFHPKKLFPLFMLMIISGISVNAQTTLVDEDFTHPSLPPGITSDGTLNNTKAADGVCSKGMIQVNKGQYLQADISSCGYFKVNMKSTASSARLLTIKAKKDGEGDYTIVTTTLSVSTAESFELTDLFPDLKSNAPISIRIEPTNGNIQIHDLLIRSNDTKSTAADITGLKIPGQIGDEAINGAAQTITIQVSLGTDLSSIVPSSIIISAQASISPQTTVAQNFNLPVTYTVTAQDGMTTKIWTVIVNQIASSEKEIAAFKLSDDQLGDAVINPASGTIRVTMPVSVALNDLVPVLFSYSANASVSPATSTPRDFSSPVVYTITAQDNSIKTWTVTVVQVDPNAVFTDYEAEDASFTGKVDNKHAGFSGTGFIDFLSADNSIVFTVCQTTAGPQTAKFRYALANDTYRKGNLFVNDEFVKLLDFPRTPTFTDWAEEIAMVNLDAGINTIKIEWDTTDGPNLDKLMLSGAACNSYTLTVNSTNGGNVIISPERTDKKYFDVETVTLLAEDKAALKFSNWTGDYSGSTNPVTIAMTADKNITAHFNPVATFKLNTVVTGIGEIELSPAGGEYTVGTVVTLTAKSILGSSFTGWTGDVSGSNPVATIAMDGVKNVTATFNSSLTIDFEKVIGFASVSADGMSAPATGGQCAADTLFIDGPSEFNKLCESLYYRQSAYKKNVTTNGMKKAPLVIMLKAGIYDGSQTLSTDGAKIFGNSMMDIPEQGDLTLIGEPNVVFKIGINVKRAWNILIRNISFQDYYDDAINIGYPETHHIWIDHCTIGHPTTRPANTEHPDGGIDIKDGASYVTVSWCLYRNSWKTGLVGHSDNNGSKDIGRLKVTYVNNYFLGTNSRNPRVRFGEVHVLNNLSEDLSLYGIAAANSAYVLAENNFYLNTRWPMYADRSVADFKAVFGNNSDGVFTSKTGNYPAFGLKQIGNGYDDSGLPLITSQINPAMLNPTGRSVKFDELNPESVFDAHAYYDYTPMTAEEVRIIVPLFAGANTVAFDNVCSKGTVPLQLLSFNVNMVNQQAKATWQTTNEQNTSGFDIERSADGKKFTKIGYVVSRNIPGENNYQFIDENPITGNSYYRLKQIDRDAQFTYSKIVPISNKENMNVSVYPNPATKSITVSHKKAGAGATMKVVTLQGQIIRSWQVPIGSTSTSANIAFMANGNYLLVFQNSAEKTVLKFVKQ